MNDRLLTISVGGSRKTTKWAATETSWPALRERLRTPIRGKESHAAYMRMTKAQQDQLKDIGGFVGGTLRGGRRQKMNVIGRDLVTLDLDAIAANQTGAVLATVGALGCASCVYSTRKHEPEKPRLRIVIPLDRTVTGEEYEPIARRIGEWLGIEQCDPTTFQSYRLMYWPSASCDSEYIYDVNEGPFLAADDVLGGYRDWRNVAEWPQVPGQSAKLVEAARKQEDPEAKAGVVGAFCRRYDIRRVLDELIPGTYIPTEDPDRLTYAHGSTAGGAIIYEGKWLYSHHATDPCGDRLVNAWDLARLHLFGEKDAEAAEGTPVNKLPSFIAMRDKALGIPEVKALLMDEARAKISEDFGTVADPDGDWRLDLELDKRGNVKGSLVNLKLIFDNDPALQPISRDVFQQRNLVRGKLPWNSSEGVRDWTDDDDTGAAWYIEAAYGVTDLRRIKMAADAAFASRESDVLVEYLRGLKWDGVPRAEKLLVKYLKAEDTAYTRAVTRKFLAAAVARAMEPGCKFDTVLTLSGPQGIGKSLLLGILGGAWYSDNVQTFTGKEAAEQLRGIWVTEIAEVDRFSAKYEAAAVKQFITRQDDIYREPYARRTAPHPRRCVFAATTNAEDFLTDATGNRRWWVVRCRATAEARGEDLQTLVRDRDQVWAEAVALWRTGESLTLDARLYAEAVEAQERAVVEDSWAGVIAEFAARRVPLDWDARTPDARRTWWADEFGQRKADVELIERRKLCVAEIWYERFGRELSALDGRTSRRIMNILRRMEGWVDLGSRPTVYGRQRCFAYDGLIPPVATEVTKTTKDTEKPGTS